MGRTALVSAVLGLCTSVAARPFSHPPLLARSLKLRGGEDAAEGYTMYPALSEEEVMEKLNTIPVFGEFRARCALCQRVPPVFFPER